MSDDILRLVHGGARMVYVGKQAGFHTRSQEEIHELLCEFASAGHKVPRRFRHPARLVLSAVLRSPVVLSTCSVQGTWPAHRPAGTNVPLC